MFSYFTPKLQLLGDSALGLLKSTTKSDIFLVGNVTIGFNFLEGLWNKDLHELFYAYYTYLQRIIFFKQKTGLNSLNHYKQHDVA